MPLDLITEQPDSPWLNALLYGPEGAGKTTGALTAPGPILYLNAEGPNAAMYARRQHPAGHIIEARAAGAESLRQAILYVQENPTVRTVVMDTGGEWFRNVLDDMTGGSKPTLPQYGDTTTIIERFCKAMRDLPVNFIVLAHELPTKDEESGVIERLPHMGTSNPALGVKVMAQADIVGYCGRIEGTDEHPEARYVAQLIPAGGRRGKDRTGLLGDFPELNFSDWLNTYTTATEPTTPAKRERETTTA